jgi:hypothetical protein
MHDQRLHQGAVGHGSQGLVVGVRSEELADHAFGLNSIIPQGAECAIKRELLRE